MWSLYTGGLYMQVQYNGQYTQGDLYSMVFIGGWSLCKVFFRVGLTVFVSYPPLSSYAVQTPLTESVQRRPPGS